MLDFKNFKFFNGRNDQEAQNASVCQTSSKSLQPWQIYGVFGCFKMAAAAILDFRNFEFLMVGRVANVELLHRTKFPRNCLNRGQDNVSFNIMLVGFENAYSRPFLEGFGWF